MKKTSKKTRKKKISNVINIILIVVCVCVLCVAAYKILSVYVDYKKNTAQVNEAKEQVFTDTDDEDGDGDEDSTDDDEDEDYDYFDFDALLAINSDAIGWIRMQGDSSADLNNPIDYPVVQTTDNEYYLKRALDGSYSAFGTIFADYRISGGLSAHMCILWGHNMRNPDDMMFGYLNYYDDEEFYEKYPYYDIWVGADHYTYKVFACGEVAVDGFFFTYSFTDSYTYMDWLSDCFDTLTIYDASLNDFSEDDYIVAFVCCVYPSDYSKRYVLLLYRT